MKFKAKKKILRFLVTSDPCFGIFSLPFFFFGYETMSNFSQNFWIDWNSAALCFK